MYSYITKELPQVLAAHFPLDMGRQGITGHSMGGHGALTIALKHPEIFRSVSAFAPIVAPSACALGTVRRWVATSEKTPPLGGL
jgi:S-formylglutathione hydrolase